MSRGSWQAANMLCAGIPAGNSCCHVAMLQPRDPTNGHHICSPLASHDWTAGCSTARQPPPALLQKLPSSLDCARCAPLLAAPQLVLCYWAAPALFAEPHCLVFGCCKRRTWVFAALCQWWAACAGGRGPCVLWRGVCSCYSSLAECVSSWPPDGCLHVTTPMRGAVACACVCLWRSTADCGAVRTGRSLVGMSQHRSMEVVHSTVTERHDSPAET